MKCLIIDVVHSSIGEALGKYMEVDTHILPTQEELARLILETENTVTTLAMAQAGVGITICPELFLRAMPAAPAKSVGVDFFPLTDPSTFGRLVAGYRQDRYLPHFGERFIALLQQAMTGDQK